METKLMPLKTIATIAASLIVLTSTSALAHASITNSSIANGATVAASPANYGVTFSAPVRLANVMLTNAAGQSVPMSYRGPAAPSAQFSIPLPRLAAGSYVMSFRAMGADGHVMVPQTRFTIGTASAAAKAPMAPMNHSKMGGMAGMNHGGTSMAVTTSIADGAVLTTPPTSMRVQFPHPMRLSRARLTVASGETIPVRFPETLTLVTATDISFPRLGADSYILTWSADAGDHAMSGTVRFTVR
jgi:copper resistance protein C